MQTNFESMTTQAESKSTQHSASVFTSMRRDHPIFSQTKKRPLTDLSEPTNILPVIKKPDFGPGSVKDHPKPSAHMIFD